MVNFETKIRMERARKLNKEIRDDDARFNRENESLEKRLMRERCYLAIAAKRGVSVETIRRYFESRSPRFAATIHTGPTAKRTAAGELSTLGDKLEIRGS